MSEFLNLQKVLGQAKSIVQGDGYYNNPPNEVFDWNANRGKRNVSRLQDLLSGIPTTESSRTSNLASPEATQIDGALLIAKAWVIDDLFHNYPGFEEDFAHPQWSDIPPADIEKYEKCLILYNSIKSIELEIANMEEQPQNAFLDPSRAFEESDGIGREQRSLMYEKSRLFDLFAG